MPYRRRRVPRSSPSRTPPPSAHYSPTSSPQPEQRVASKFAARLEGDVTVPPGTAVAPGVTFIKTWAVANTGSTAWSRVFLVFRSGALLAQSPSIALPDLGPGESVNVSLEVQAPEVGGRATSAWAFIDSAGSVFGPSLLIDVTVAAPHASDINAARDALAALIRVGAALDMGGLPEPHAPPLDDGPSVFPYLEEIWSMAKALEAHVGAEALARAATPTQAASPGRADGADAVFEMVVRWRSGNKMFTLSVSPAHTIADVKDVVAAQAELPVQSLSLSPAFPGNVPPDNLVLLDPTRTLGACGIGQGTVLELLVAPSPAVLGQSGGEA